RRQPRTPCRQTRPPRPFQPFGRFRATQRRPHQGPTPRGRPAHLHQGPSRTRLGGGGGRRGPEPVLPRPVRARRTGTDQDRHHVAPVHPHQWGTHRPRCPRPPTRRGAVPHPRRVRYTHRPCLRHHWRTRTLRPWLRHRDGGPHRHRGGRRMGGHHPVRRRGRPHPEAGRGRRGRGRGRPRGRTGRHLGQPTHPPARPGRGRSPVTMTSHAKNPHAIAAEDWTPWPEEFAHTYREAGYWTGETFPAFLRERATRFAEHTAVVDGHNRWTYAELDRRADSLATGLARLGVAEGDRVVVHLPNTATLIEVIFALFRLGALPVYALPAHRHSELIHLARTAEAIALVTSDTHAGFDCRPMADRVRSESPSLKHVLVAGDPGKDSDGFTALETLRDEPERAALADPDPGTVAFFQLSGGTTGLPKLIPRTHDDYLYSVRASADICALDTDTVYLGAMPITHNFPMSSPGFLGVLHAGGTVVLAPDPSPDTALALVEREHITHTAVVPPVAMLWLDAVEHGPQNHRDLSSLRVLQVGGATFAEEAARRVTPVLGCALQQVFGMAEGLVNYTRHDDPDDLVVTTQGRPISDHDEIRIVDDHDHPVPEGEPGHLLTRGPYTIRGYYRAPEHNATAFTADGFYRTGDIVR